MIQDPAVRDTLSQDYRRVIDRANVDLAHVLILACEAAKDDCEKTLNTTLAEMWHRQHQLPNNAFVEIRFSTKAFNYDGDPRLTHMNEDCVISHFSFVMF